MQYILALLFIVTRAVVANDLQTRKENEPIDLGFLIALFILVGMLVAEFVILANGFTRLASLQ